MSIITTPTTLPLTTGEWAIDPVHSTVNFSVRHLGLAKVRGQFTDFSGAVTVGTDLASTTVQADIALDSVDTGNPDRDGHLRSVDFFDAETNRAMTFRSTAISGEGTDYELVGDLTIGSTTKSVMLEVEFFGVEDYPMDDSTRAGFSATTTISRSEFGIEFDIPLGGDKVAIGDKVKVELDVQIIAP